MTSPADDLRTLRSAADILHRHGQHTTAEQCLNTAASLAVDIALDTTRTDPARRLTPLTERH